jgi:hypothetical protein
MLDRRLAATGLGLLAVVTFGVAGCTSGGDAGTAPAPTASTGPSASAAADPAAAAALGAAAAKLGTSSFKATLTSGPALTVTTLADAPQGVGTSTARYTGGGADITVQALLVDKDLWVKVPGVTAAGTWMHVDVARLPDGANVGLRPGQIDPANTAQLLSSTSDVRQTGPGTYAGTLDLTTVAGVAGLDRVTIGGYGRAASAVPFRAALDDQGRLAQLNLDLPAVNGQQAQPLEVLYTDYGTTVVANKPAPGEVVEAPESVYKTLGG